MGKYEKTYTCETCNKVFASSSGRKFHADSTGHKFANYTPNSRALQIPKPEVLARGKQIKALLDQGFSPSEVANKLGIKVHVVYYHRAKGGSNGIATVTGNGAGTHQSQPQGAGSDRNEDALIAYIFGRTQAQVESYAQSVGLPAATVTSRLGKLLLRS